MQKRFILFFIVLLSVCNFAFGQDTLLIKGAKPFDKPFLLKYQVPKTVKITRARIVMVGKNGCLKNIKKRHCVEKSNANDIDNYCEAILSNSELIELTNKLLTQNHFSIDSLKRLPVTAEISVRIASLLTKQKKLVNKLTLLSDQNTTYSNSIVGLRQVGDSGVYPIQVPIAGQDTLGNVYVNMFPLKPNKRYLLIFDTVTVPTNIAQVIKDIDNDDLPAAEEAFNLMRSSKITISTVYQDQCAKCGKVSFSMQSYGDFKIFFDQYLIELRDSLKDLNKKSDELKMTLCSPTITKLSQKYLQNIIYASQECKQCKDTVWQYLLLTSNKNVYNTLINIFHLNDTALSYGYTTIDSFNHALNLDTVKMDKRSVNLSATIKTVDEFIKLLEYYDDKYNFQSSEYLSCRTELDAALKCLKENYALLYKKNEITNSKKKIESATSVILAKWAGFMMPMTSFTTVTSTYDFQTRTGFAVKPDFGFLVYGNLFNNAGFWHGRNNANFWGVSPFLGFHVNVRPLDTDVPFKTIPGFAKHISFNAGVMLVSVADSGKTKGLIGNTSIFTGMGYAFGHGVRLIGGAVWFQAQNPDPTINRANVAAVPYIGLSIDLRIKDIYQSFKNIFP